MHKLEGRLVLNVQNQYKGIAHMIEKKMKKILYHVLTDFIPSPKLAGELENQNITQEGKNKIQKYVLIQSVKMSSCCIRERQQISRVQGVVSPINRASSSVL